MLCAAHPFSVRDVFSTAPEWRERFDACANPAESRDLPLAGFSGIVAGAVQNEMGTMLKQMMLWCAVAGFVSAGEPSAAELPTMALSINGHRLVAEVAANTQTRATGLMNRFSLKPDHGMLFVFRDQRPLSFWMKNTYVALSIAYIDSRGTIIGIEDMAPQTETMHPSSAPAQYALEMKKGWFKERGIGAGAVVTGLDKAPRAED